MNDAIKLKRIAAAIAETVAESGPEGAPEGILYAGLMGMLDLAEFQAIVDILVSVKLVQRAGNHVLVKGPAFPARA